MTALSYETIMDLTAKLPIHSRPYMPLLVGSGGEVGGATLACATHAHVSYSYGKVRKYFLPLNRVLAMTALSYETIKDFTAKTTYPL